MKNPSVIDTRAQDWGRSLIPNVQKACDKIFGDSGCPVAPELGSPWWSHYSEIFWKNVDFNLYAIHKCTVTIAIMIVEN